MNTLQKRMCRLNIRAYLHVPFIGLEDLLLCVGKRLAESLEGGYPITGLKNLRSLETSFGKSGRCLGRLLPSHDAMNDSERDEIVDGGTTSESCVKLGISSVRSTRYSPKPYCPCSLTSK
jgi:hypothetical protein